ncbi:MAG TPA: hypothetical protein PKC58_12645 [Ignavibacteria bacterium]|nr:hypothetical protein [Ignavibacteria bacterium]
MWVTDNTVRTIVVAGDHTYLGGDFNYAGSNTGNGSCMNSASPKP